jgi:hypothetical protein
MSNSQVEISKIEIDPNRLRSYSKVPLPSFAVKALHKHGFNYPTEVADSNQSELHLQRSEQQCTLALHLQSIKPHTDRDGPRLYNAGSGTDEWNQRSRQFAEADRASSEIHVD